MATGAGDDTCGVMGLLEAVVDLVLTVAAVGVVLWAVHRKTDRGACE